MDAERYLRVEGVNIYANLADTNQLSVIRGGSFLLKDAIEAVAQHGDFRNELEEISTGASEGIFRLKNAESKLDDLVKSIALFLGTHKNYQHLTFTTVGHTSSEAFQTIKKQLIAKSRFLQMQQLTAPVDPDPACQSAPCELEGIRPQAENCQIPINGEKRNVSASIAARWHYGVDQRRSFYISECKRAGRETVTIPDEYTRDIESLANHPSMGNLNDKVAVVYFDGNGFGKVQAEHVKTVDQQIDFDTKIKRLRAEFLTNWLQQLKNTEDSRAFVPASPQTNGKRALRFETLLWGGDEMIFVVPAWLGFELVQFFYDASKNWEYQGQTLTHAGGIVFCHAKTPIFRIRQLAQELADNIKEQDGGRNENRFDYTVLESIDYPTEELKQFMHTQYGELTKGRAAMRAVDDWPSMSKELKGLGEVIPRTQLYALAQLACHLRFDEKNLDAEQERFDLQEHRFQAMLGNDIFDDLLTLTNRLFVTSDVPTLQQRCWRWLHLVELWDYLLPPKASTKNKEAE